MGRHKNGYKDLIVWQRAKDLAVLIYKLSEKDKLRRSFILMDQIRRSAVSIPSNLAEGDERETDKEAVRFFYVAKGSLAELRTQLQIATEAGLLDEPIYNSLERDCVRLGNMIGKLIQARLPATRR